MTALFSFVGRIEELLDRKCGRQLLKPFSLRESLRNWDTARRADRFDRFADPEA